MNITDERFHDTSDAAARRKQKRDRENGMYQDPLVEERTDERAEELQRKLEAMKRDNRLHEVYDFIIKHRPGTPVRPYLPVRGSYNAVFRVEYTDGSALLRLAIPGPVAFPDEKVRAEVATLRYVEKMTTIPVPHVYHWGTAAENPLGLGAFIIMEYIPHEHTLDDILSDPTVKDAAEGYLDPNIPRDKLARMYRQVASIMLQLSQLQMPKIGSLQMHGNSFTIGSRPLTQEMNDLVVQGGIPPSIFPPEDKTYSTSAEWYAALADMHIAHLTFQRNKAIESADDCRDKFVARYLFRQRVRQGKLLEEKPPKEKKGNQKETFRLWMEDFRPHNILVDADLNIVGVIDWEWAYFAPESFVHDPPWWLLLSRPEYWRGTVLEFRDEFVGVLEVFFDALRAEEDRALQGDRGQGEGGEEDDEWSLDQHIEALSIRRDEVRLSDRMRRSWESGRFWANYAARKCYGFDPVFWEFLDECFFGRNVEGGYEGRMHLLPEKVKRRMELFVERKVEESKEEKIVDWDPEAARSYLAGILADLD